VSVETPPPAAEALLGTDGLAVGRGAVLLHDVCLRIGPGEWWFVLGRNGAGKSTLLLTLLGLLPARGGSVVAARAVADRSGVGYVPQELPFPVDLPLTVREFVAMGLAGLRLRAGEAGERVRGALARLQVEDLALRPLRRLSLGQRRRALVARALARAPVLLVLDEPAANLDPHAAAALADDLAALRRDGLSIVQASHDLGLARAFATHVALLHGGTVLAGPATAVLGSRELASELGAG
jgi:ABC-type Mn2+/Zn2+ transport system ATPase subunit